ncbi:MAG TPA: DUF2911 domain-containing protein [Gemmatimonadaceae bacterium]|nr:DUF2911 domain-containing protein [Gemmatimonadaceae bacterium]
MPYTVPARSHKVWCAIACTLLLGVSAAHRADAQEIRKSQLGTVSQNVANTRIDITYRRPVARGRELFGTLVPWSRVWSPSADTAAVITFSDAVTINGDSLPAGTFSVWTIPEKDSWTVIFAKDHPVHHTRYREGGDVLRVKTTPREGEHVETLAFTFPTVDADSAELVLHWGKTVVPLKIRAR